MKAGLKRNPSNKVIAGVCSGLARHLNIDPTIVRLIFVFLAIFAFGGVIVYIVLWAILPEGNYVLDENEYASQGADAKVDSTSEQKGKTQLFMGTALIIIGVLLLVIAFIPQFNFWDFWPLAFIVAGVLLLNQARKKTE
jgi:phage shock protein C